MLIGQTAWDVTRFADRVKNLVLPESGIVSDADARLNVYFEQAAFGDITEPEKSQKGIPKKISYFLHNHILLIYHNITEDLVKLFNCNQSI